MRNRSIDADDQIEVMDQRRRVGKVMQILGEIVQLHTVRRMGCLSRRPFCNEMNCTPDISPSSANLSRASGDDRGKFAPG